MQPDQNRQIIKSFISSRWSDEKVSQALAKINFANPCDLDDRQAILNSVLREIIAERDAMRQAIQEDVAEEYHAA